MLKNKPLPKSFRKLSVSERVNFLSKTLKISDEEIQIISANANLSALSDVLIETAIGTFPVPLGLATGFVIDGQEYHIPMATEEPSVIAGASHAAMLIKSGGGFKTWSSDPVMTAQIYLINTILGAKDKILQSEEKIRSTVSKIVPKMSDRGGGYRGFAVTEIDDGRTLIVSVDLDVQDAMGANVTNTVSEGLKILLSEISGGSVLMAILTNASEKRRARASIQVPEKALRKDPFSGEEVCKRIVAANTLANACPERAITHNKGIMNGISALTLATGNDTRAIEAAAHYYAQKSGQYRPLTSYSYENGFLKGVLELPLPLGTKGGAISVWPAAQMALSLLGNPTARELSRIAVSLGLAQNLAALFALVTEGIQSGHMKLHAAKIAYTVGARGNEVRALAARLWNKKLLDPLAAKKILEEMRSEDKNFNPVSKHEANH